jgi:hypothetical protein
MPINKKFDKWVSEASLKDNPAFPGEGGTKGPNYLEGVEKKASRDLQDLSRRYGQDIPRFMGIVAKVKAIQEPYKAELEKIAYDVMMDMYGSILSDVDLVVKFPKESEMQDMMKDVNPEPPEEEKLKALQDKDIISKIQRIKLGRNIVQGEAKNAKKALNSDFSLSEIEKLMGKEKADEYISLLNKITDIASFFDWQIPMEVQKQMWERDRSGFSGTVKVEWPERDQEEEEEDSRDAIDILNDIEKNQDFDLNDTEEVFDGNPKITALGTDYAMLLHEAIKGIYQSILSAAIPEDAEKAEIVLMNTDSFADEIEDLRYGPYIAADLRDFINTFPESNSIPNLREYVFGYLVNEENLSDEAFLKTFNDILLGIPKLLGKDSEIDPKYKVEIEAAASRAKDSMKKIIREISDMIGDYERDAASYGSEEPGAASDSGQSQGANLSNMGKDELQKMLDKALDSRDFAKAKEISDILNNL